MKMKKLFIPIIILFILFILGYAATITYYLIDYFSCKSDNILLENTKFEKTSNTFIKKYILTDIKREFYISTPSCLKRNLPIILLFHGGGEEPWNEEGTGIMNYTGLWSTNSICIAFKGQISNNRHSWQNAFPWLRYNIENDIMFVETVIERLKNSNFSKYCNFNRIYASGKSDGGGFCFYLLEYSSLNITKIGICSSAHFTLHSRLNTKYLSNTIRNIPILAVHGTGDIVMPFKGQHFLNKHAEEKAEYWREIDPSLKNTYTFDIPYFWNYIGYLFNKDKPTILDISNNITLSNWGNVKLITAKNQNHCWMGHKKSGPDSDKISNFQFDATSLICKFFDNIKLLNYTNLTNTPENLMKSVSS